MPVAGVLAVHTALVVLPGLLLGLAAGLRGWLLAASAPVLTYGVVGVGGAVVPLLGATWSALSPALVAVGMAAALAAGRLALRRLRPTAAPAAPGPRPLPWRPVHHAGVAGAVLFSLVVGVVIAADATRGFTAVPQVWDAVFHSNAIRYIADTGQSDPAALRNLNEPAGGAFYYPNAYHVLAATVVMITGESVPVVVDVTVALFPGLLALGTVALVRHVGGRPALAVAAGLLSCAFTAFPYDLLPWGTLLPFITAVALLPAFLAALAAMLGDPRPGALPVTLAVSGIGLLALHPSGAVAAALLSVALLGQRGLERALRPADLRSLGATVVAALVLGAPLLTASARAASGPSFDWPANMTPAAAAGELLLLSHSQLIPQYWLVAAVAVGLLVRAPLRPLLWFVAVAGVFAVLFVMTAAYENALTAALTRPWWNDRWRFAALFTLGAVLLAAGGLVVVRDAVWRALSRVLPSDGPRRTLASGAVLGAVLALFAVSSGGLYAARNTERLAQGFTDGPTVSAAEELAYDELARIVPDGAYVMNDPYDGSALMWALDGVRPVFASPVIAPQELDTMDPERLTLFTSFNELDTDPAVQRAASSLGIDYVVLGTGFIAPADDHAPGMRDLGRVRALVPVYENAEARIFRIAWDRLGADRG